MKRTNDNNSNRNNDDGYHVKVHGPYSLSKDALREEGTP
jgi:hypothetical protein